MLDRLLFYLGSRLGKWAVLLLASTWWVRVRGFDAAERLMKERKPLVLITWHGLLLPLFWQGRHHQIVAMISQHRDGELVARVVQKLGYETVRGSSTRGGSAATLEILEEIRGGRTAAMIGDGPRGPIHKLKPGAAFLAIQAGATVIPAAFHASRAWEFRSWDRFTLPKPFARVTILYGEPVPHPGYDADLKAFTRKLEEALNETMNRVRSA